MERSEPPVLRACVNVCWLIIKSNFFLDSECSQKSKAKRVRTTFTEDQLQVLQANFQLDSNPDGQDLERIAQITGLSKRVTQVWFQNSRARQKKQQQGGEHTSPSSNSSPSKPHSKWPSRSSITRHVNSRHSIVEYFRALLMTQVKTKNYILYSI